MGLFSTAERIHIKNPAGRQGVAPLPNDDRYVKRPRLCLFSLVLCAKSEVESVFKEKIAWGSPSDAWKDGGIKTGRCGRGLLFFLSFQKQVSVSSWGGVRVEPSNSQLDVDEAAGWNNMVGNRMTGSEKTFHTFTQYGCTTAFRVKNCSCLSL